MSAVADLAPPSFGRNSLTLGRRAVRVWMKNPASIIGAIVFPLVFFSLFNLTMRRLMTARGFDYAQQLPATVIIQAMFFAGMSSAYYVAADRQSGMIQRLRSMPIHQAAPIVGRSVGDVSRAALSVLVLTVVGVAAGLRFRAGVVPLLGFLVVPIVFAAVVALAMGLIGYRASSPDAAASLASIPYLPFVMLSSGFAPVSDFPGWLRPFVRNQPTTHTIELLRALSSGGPTRAHAMAFVAWMVPLGLGLALLGGRAFRRTS